MRRRYCRKHINARRSTRLPLTFMLLLFAVVSVAPLAAQSWYNAAWTSRQQITINSNAVAYNLTGDLAKFPFLVTITGANDLFTKAQASGNDIVFTASDGVTKIPHEIENYNSAGQNLTAWVQLPVFSHSAPTVIFVYYGNPSAANQQQPTQVWDSSYGSVYHLKETGHRRHLRGQHEQRERRVGRNLHRQPVRPRGPPAPRLRATARPSTRPTLTSSRCQVRWGSHRVRQ